MKSNGFPHVEQETPTSCGVACLEAMYEWMQLDTPEYLSSLSDEQGFVGGIPRMEEELGHLGEVERSWTLFDLPLVVLLWSEDCEHWSVVVDAGASSVVLMDPSESGLVTIPIDDFRGMWENDSLQEKCLGLYCGEFSPLQGDQ